MSFKDISRNVYGKYTHCWLNPKDGLWYSEEDLYNGKLKRGALPAPWQDTPELIEKAKLMHEAAQTKRPWWRFWL